MKKSIRTWLLTAASLAIVSVPTITQVSAQEGTIATIGETELTAEDLYQEMKEQYGEVALRSKIIEAVLEENVKDPEAARKNATEEVQKQIKELGGEEVFQQFLSYQSLGTVEQYEYQLYIRNMLQEVVEGKLDLSDEAIKNYYENDYQPMMEAQHILVDTEEEAKEAIQRINDGEEFDAVAQEVSKDSTAQNGGLLTPFSTGQMVPEFEEAVKSLDNGEMTKEPVKSEFGFHVIKAINNGEKKSLEENRDEIVELYKQSKYEDSDFTYGIVGELIKQSKIEIQDEDLKGAVDDLIALADQQAEGGSEDEGASTDEEASTETPTEETTTEDTAENAEEETTAEVAE
ncbi:peptidylprolyl isomerase [Facklamia sp. DSM 111018]|uniref:Foldase protein PrsA n=1 Tax=Facklamia lactis TaxID=2749967 RepID=A0ABS0LPC2_9LACT|nr:peptidylprolyl isomerase [Facklamia lactis]MBG9980203.1 peptidylprolyl isomerase [Facklamia lactis]MBG9986006.1 peptidylprolyl isomerase [Facklamia lactis]